MTKIKKKFYSLINKGGVIGVKEQDGYQIESNDMRIYIYEEYYNLKTYFIDPDTGIALHIVNDVGIIDDIEYDPYFPITELQVKLEKLKQTKKYPYWVMIFEKYKEARLFDEKCRLKIQDIERNGRA